MNNKIPWLIIFLSFSLFGLRQAHGRTEEYLQAQESVKSGNKEFAFIYFLSELRNNPQSKKRPEALFATAEYLFLIHDYNDAFNVLVEFIGDYPLSEMRTCALFYMLKIAQTWGKEDLAKAIEKQIINLKRTVFLFQETKEYNFKSPLNINHKLIYHIDKLEFYSDGNLQAQIFY